MKPTLARLQQLANAVGVALLLWLVMPLLTINGVHPLESTRARGVALLWVAVLLLGALLGWQGLKTRRNARLLDQLQAGDAAASQALTERFRAAMNLLKSGGSMDGPRATGWHRWRRALLGGRQLYQLPWYLIIGAPGAGKTTALLHSGLRFPLAERLGAAPVAGIGGTRQCDWWFTDRAVFIDTAGRYTTQDSHAAADAREWQTFLQLLRRHRPVQPVNGVIVTVSVPDLLQGGAELEAQAAAVDLRLKELRTELGLSFPVYLLVTKADLLAGFVEFFGDFNAEQREQLWGLTFDYPAPDGALPPDLSAQLAGLAQRVAALCPQRLQQEPQPQRRAAIYHFAAQVEALLPALEGFARRALGRTGESPRQTVRGIHLTSGTQEGNPIDRVLGELARSYGMAVRTLARPDAGGKAYFLTALLQRLVIAEAPLAGANLARLRQRRWLSVAASGVVAAGLVMACGLWWHSYRSNLEYVESVRGRVEQLAQQTGALQPGGAAGRIDALLPLYDVLGSLAVSGTVDPKQPPPGFGFGLFQGPRLAQAADQTYHRVLDQTLAPLLADRLSQALRQQADPAARYDALRITLMLVKPERMQRAEVRRWAAAAIAAPSVPETIDGESDGAAATPADGLPAHAPGAGEQQEWLRHLDALLERNAVVQVVRLDDALVAAARKALAGVPLAERVHQRLLRRAAERAPGALALADVAGPSAALVFAPPEAALPAVDTRAAWREQMLPTLDATVREVADEASWVLGDRSPALQRLTDDGAAREEVSQQVAQRHAKAVGSAWERWLSGLSLAAAADGEALRRQGADLAGTGSVPRVLMHRLATEFSASAAPGSAASASADKAYDAALPARLIALGDYARGPGPSAIARLAPSLATALRDGAGTSALPAADLARDLRSEAARAPTPLREIWAALATAVGTRLAPASGGPSESGESGSSGLAALSQACHQLIDDRFPFAQAAKRDMPFADFARLFGPNGLLDTYFRAHLASQTDARSRPWRPVAGASGDAKAQAALPAFEMAADIRGLFFATGEPLPQLALKLTPIGMDEQLLQFSVDVDGQLLRYENGPRRTKLLSWPGPGGGVGGQQRVLMRIFPTGPSGVDAEVHEGPWALLRVLKREGSQPTGNRPADVRLAVDGRSLKLEAATDGPVPIGLLAELPNFRCPQ